jgi:putative ABC transport system permease protein
MFIDLRYALRSLRRSPSFTAAAVLTLALGIGANTAIFSVVDAVLLRSVPFEAVDRLLMVWETDRNSGTTREPASFPDFLDFQSRSLELESAGALMGAQMTAVAEEGAPERLTALAVTHDLLQTLGIRGIRGRNFLPAEDRPNGDKVAIINEQLLARLFGGNQDVLGRVLRLDEVPHTIVGVVPEGADLGVLQILSAAAYARAFADQGTRADVDVWVPLQASAETLPRQTHPLFVIGRLAPDASVASARDELTAIAADLEQTYPVNDGRGVFVEPLSTVMFGPVRPALLVLTVAVGLVLLVACANAANLLLARATSRRRDVAVRRALGAGARRLLPQFLFEGLVLSSLALMVGLGMASAGLETLTALAPPDIPRLDEMRLNGQVLGVAVALSFAVGVVFGLVPLVQARQVDVQGALKGALPSGRRGHGTRAMLVVTQVALAVLLVVGAGLLVRSFWSLLQVDPGFSTGGVLKAEYQLPSARYSTSMARWPNFTETHAFNDELLRRVSALGVTESAAMAGNHPLDAGSTNSFVVVGREAEAGDWPEISIRRVTSDYFRTVGLSLVRGRLIDDRDDERAATVALINEAAVGRFFPDRDPLGQQLGFWGAERTIVGVVADERFQGLEQASPVAVYLPLPQAPSTGGVYALMLRTNRDPASVAPTIGRIVRELDPDLALFGVEPLDVTMSRSVAQRRFVMTLLGLFALLAIALAAIGIHGVLGYDVAQRTREIGIRMSLGARPGDVVGLVVRQGLSLILLGLAVGLAAAFLMTRAMTSLLYGVTPADTVTLLAAPALLLFFGLLACLLPARRAARVAPSVALRVE